MALTQSSSKVLLILTGLPTPRSANSSDSDVCRAGSVLQNKIPTCHCTLLNRSRAHCSVWHGNNDPLLQINSGGTRNTPMRSNFPLWGQHRGPSNDQCTTAHMPNVTYRDHFALLDWVEQDGIFFVIRRLWVVKQRTTQYKIHALGCLTWMEQNGGWMTDPLKIR